MNPLDVTVGLLCCVALWVMVGRERVRQVWDDMRDTLRDAKPVSRPVPVVLPVVRVDDGDGIARTEEELERLVNVPCAPNPRMRV